MSALVQESPNLAENSSITSISANARIDYILRFSKQAILLIDENSEVSSNVCRQLLGTLPAENNAAYIAISPKLNDIQIRCRIIEQLYANTLFDPEQSLAVSIINLAKPDNKTLSIVVDNMHNASLQILHELTQLAVIAKKSQANVNVVMAGSLLSGQLAAQNASLFNNNLSVLSAETGQLVPLGSSLLKITKNFKLSKPVKIFTSIFFVLILAAATVYMNFDRIKVFNFSDLSLLNGPKSEVKAVQNVSARKALIVSSSNTEAENIETTLQSTLTIEGSSNTEPTDNVEQATTFEILAYLENPELLQTTETKADESPISPTDILNAITNIAPSIEVPVPEVIQKTPIKVAKGVPENLLSPELSASRTNTSSLVLSGVSNDYYGQAMTNNADAYVVQYSGFTQQQALDDFLLAYRELNYQAYQRLLNKKEMLVLTSLSFKSAQVATNYLNSLPESIKASGAFIKSLSAINTEINAFESSQ